ncbi:MAG: helix-turn-helix domain-containing protein [Pseudomonadota bacterium]
MPSDHDTELGTIFREMRRAMGVSRERIAGRLATPVETIDMLESGDLLALPEWSEVTRVVTAYTAQLGLDSRPILRRMQVQISALKPNGAANAGLQTATVAPAAVQPTPSPPEASSKLETGPPQPGVPDVDAESAGPTADLPAVDADFLPEPTPADPQTAELEKPARGANFKARVSGVLRTAGNWLLLIGLVGVLGYGLWFASQNPRAVWSTVDSLPDPLPGAMRGAWELVRPFDDRELRPQVSDPDNRKSDKLP